MPRPPLPLPPNAGASADFAASTGSGTPPPFGSEPTGSMPSLQPLRAQTAGPAGHTAPVVVVQHKRSIIWPLLAVAMVAVAGGALFLVWQQMQQQQPAEIKITQREVTSVVPNVPDDAFTVEPDDTVDAVDDAVDPVHSSRGAGPDPKKPNITQPPKRRLKTYDEVIADKKSEMEACVRDHRAGIQGAEISASVTVATSGRTKSVQLTPDRVNAAPFGACLRNVLMRANFPAAPSEAKFSFPLRLKSS
jgi:hypothetical protein